jgi:hypothetical protein
MNFLIQLLTVIIFILYLCWFFEGGYHTLFGKVSFTLMILKALMVGKDNG